MASNGMLRRVLPVMGIVVLAAVLTLKSLAATLPPGQWWQALADPGADTRSLVFSEMQVPRVLMSWVVGAGLAMSGVLLQQVLRNPLAETSTLGISAGAYLALAAASLFAPAVLEHGQEAVALAGSAGASLLVLLMARSAGFSSLSAILAGLAFNLLFGAIGAVLTVLNHDTLSTLFIWQTGSLVQNGWGDISFLAPRLAVCALAAALLQRPLSMMALDDTQVRSFGLTPGMTRAAVMLVAAVIGALCVSAVGVIAFVGIVAPQAAQALGARTLGQRLLWAPIMGALLLWLADAGVQAAGFRSEIPTGTATALIGAALLIPIVLRQHMPDPVDIASPHPGQHRILRPRAAIAIAAIILVAIGVAAAGLGRTPEGWQLASPSDAGYVLPWRLPRVLAAASTGAMLAVAGLLLQRITNNPMGSPETLGISSGATLGIIALLFAVPGFSSELMLGAGCAGALTVLLLITAVNWRADFSSGQLLLMGMSLATMFSAATAVLLTSGDPRAAILVTWMSGSTYRVSAAEAETALTAAVTLIPIGVFFQRWLTILPLRAEIAQALGIDVRSCRLAILLLIAVLTTVATIVVGPLSFVGLLAPHIVRGLGARRPVEQIALAAAVGAALMMFADWLGRTVLFPWQIPAGLVATLVGAPCLIWLLRKPPRQ